MPYERTMEKDMMATKATHKLGDISRDEEDIAFIYAEDGEFWIGQWWTGFGFFDVKFPKATTRELTEEEVNFYEGRALRIGSGPAIPQKVHGYDHVKRKAA